MIDHPAQSLIEQLALGALEDDAVIEHCATCDTCAASLAREASLELALGELHAFRAQQDKSRRVLLTRFAPVLVFAAAAAVLLMVRRSAPRIDVQADPSARPAMVAMPSAATTPSDMAEVVAKLRPRFRACYQDNLSRGGPADGRIVLAADLDANGAVLDVTVASNDGFPPEVGTCLAGVVRSARFTGTGSPTTIDIPVAFVAQR